MAKCSGCRYCIVSSSHYSFVQTQMVYFLIFFKYSVTEDGREYNDANATPYFELDIESVQVLSILFVILPEQSTSGMDK